MSILSRFLSRDSDPSIVLNSDLTGMLLVASPDMGDPRFSRAVILIAAYDQTGAAGFVLNKPHAEQRLPALMHSIQLVDEDTRLHDDCDIAVYQGGPVEEGRGFLIHSQETMPVGSIPIGDICAISGSQESLTALAQGKGAEHNFFCLGYSGWEEGQMEQELKENAWLVVPATESLIFDTDKDHLWERSLAQIGVQAYTLSQAGRA